MKTNLNALKRFTYLSVMFFALIFVRGNAKAQDYNDYSDPSGTDPNDQNQYYQSDENPDGNMDYFDQQLSDDGQWVEVNREDIDPGNSAVFIYVDNDVNTEYIWVPNDNSDPDFNPYHNGRWVWTYYGWQWVSNYSWGYAPYHYGRWWYSNNYGWVWSPGYRWAPAWVDWCRSDDYVGWYPVSPREHCDWEDWDENYEHRHVEQYWTDWNHNVTPNWTFVNTRDFNKTITPSITVTSTNFSNVINNTKQISGNTVIDRRIVNEGPDPKNFGISKTKQVTVNNPLKNDNEKNRASIKKNDGYNTQKNNGYGEKVRSGNASITKTPYKVSNETINKTPDRTKGFSNNKDKTQFNTKNNEKFNGTKQGSVINSKRTNDKTSYNTKKNDTRKADIIKQDYRSGQKVNNSVDTRKSVLKTNGNVKKSVTYNNTDTKKYKVNDNNVNTKRSGNIQTPKQDVYKKNIQPKTEYKQPRTEYKQQKTEYKQPVQKQSYVQKQQNYTPRQDVKTSPKSIQKTSPQVKQEKSNVNSKKGKSDFSKKIK